MVYRKFLTTFGRGFGFNLALTIAEPQIIESFRQYLAHFTPGDFQTMLGLGQPPPFPPRVYKQVSGLEDQIAKLQPQLVFEFLAKARPDIAEALAAFGPEACVKFIEMIKAHIIQQSAAAANRETNPEKSPALSPEDAPAPSPQEQPSIELDGKTKKVSCEQCGYSFEITPEEAAALKECPECGAEA